MPRRERLFQYFSGKHGTPGGILRINYAVEMRYGVLHDLPSRVMAGQFPIGAFTIGRSG